MELLLARLDTEDRPDRPLGPNGGAKKEINAVSFISNVLYATQVKMHELLAALLRSLDSIKVTFFPN